MATVTSFTAERMLQIENTTVVDGDVVGDNLILKQRDGTTIDAGSVRGPQGVVGPAGPSLPPGAMTMFAGAAAPTGYLMCDGASISRVTYAALFAAIGTSYGSVDANTFSLPDLKNKFPVGKGTETWSDALNERGGNKDNVLVSHAHAGGSHSHSINIGSDNNNQDHAHLSNFTSTGASVDHTHSSGASGWIGRTFAQIQPSGSSGIYAATDPTNEFGGFGGQSRDHSHNSSGYSSGANIPHAHGVNGSTSAIGVATDTQGSSPINTNLPPYITINFIIKI